MVSIHFLQVVKFLTNNFKIQNTNQPQNAESKMRGSGAQTLASFVRTVNFKIVNHNYRCACSLLLLH